jgi:NIMA (never in mitosis gene a)-related kinase
MKNNDVKLGDSNVAKVIKMNFAYTQTGTPFYASPEVYLEKPYSKSDMWSIGVIFMNYVV